MSLSSFRRKPLPWAIFAPASVISLSCYASDAASAAPSKTIRPDEVMVVTASRIEQPISTILAPMSVLTREDLKQLQATSLVDGLKALPGIEIGQSGGRGQSASIFLRGNESNHVLVLVDGVPLPNAMLGTIDFNMLPLDSIERIEVIRGAGATAYGSDAIGGVINIITRSDVNQGYLRMGIGSMGSGIGSVGVTTALTDSLTLQLSGGIEQTEGYNVHPNYAPADEKHGFVGKNALLRLGYAPSEHWQSNVVARWYQNAVEYDNYGVTKNLWVSSKTLGFDTTYRQGPWQNVARFTVSQQKNYDYETLAGKNDSTLTSEIRQYYASLLSRYQFVETFNVSLGADLKLEQYLDGTFINKAMIEDNPRSNVGLFLLANWNITDNLLLETSGRMDKNQQFGSHLTGQASLGWEFIPQYRVVASYGNAFKAPTFDVLYGFGGNLNLQPETAKLMEVGLEGVTFGVDWGINGYINQIDNLITYSGFYPNGTNENIERAEIKGVELAANFNLGPVYNELSVDLRNPQDKTKNEQLGRRAKQVAKWRATVDVGDFTFGTQYQYQSKRLDYAGGPMLASYSLWDLTAKYQVNQTMALNAKVANLFNKQYETAGEYPAPERAVYFNLDFSF